jgi:nucleoid-associated protein YgaU
MHKLLHIVKTVAPGAILAALLGACSGPAVMDNLDAGYYEDEPPPESAEPAKPAEPETTGHTPVRIALRDDVPDHYVVKKGDTLWDISALFLRDPWLWPEIWYFNPQIDNPHLIYPGDILTLVYVDGKPQLRLTREGTTEEPPSLATAPAGINTVKLSPHVRTEDLKQAIPTIPIDVIGPFLIKPRIVSKEELDTAPYIVSSLDEHLITASGNTVYARNLKGEGATRYNIFRPGRVFKDPKTGEVLGYEATLVSEAKLLQPGDPATLVLTRSLRETLNGDRILSVDSGKISHNFIPQAPSTEVEGQIIALIDAISHTAQRQIVVINLGHRQGMIPGTVLAVEQAGAEVRDPYAREGSRTVTLPNTQAGLLMVFRVFDKVSYGLIMNSSRTIHTYDVVRNPQPSAAVFTQ